MKRFLLLRLALLLLRLGLWAVGFTLVLLCCGRCPSALRVLVLLPGRLLCVPCCLVLRASAVLLSHSMNRIFSKIL